MKAIVNRLGQTGALVVPIALFVSIVVDKMTSKINRVQYIIKQEAVVPPAPPSSEPSDDESSSIWRSK